MRLKSYFSGTVEAAMELARKELGEDALLINARPSTPETRYLGAYEVVFGVAPPSPPPEAPPASGATLRSELVDLCRRLERLAHSLRTPAAAAPAGDPVEAALLAADVDPEWAHRLAGGTPLEGMISTDPSLGRPGQQPAAAALIGPPGAGKTTTLVKLAARYGIAAGRSIQILTTDVRRIAAADQLRTLAAILGVPCDVAETPAALAAALNACRSRQLVLIDTAGFSLRDWADAGEWAAWFASRPDIDIHLVLPASLRTPDLRRLADAYSTFRPAKLLFTRLDETSQTGALINEAARLSLPLSFLTHGQDIPEDLEEASIERLAGRLGVAATGVLRRGAAA
jgi:flagellar biosynthesis protein FlhF